MHRRWWAACVGFAVVVQLPPIIARAQDSQAKSPVKWTLALAGDAERVTAGSMVVAELSAKIDDGWHIYAPGQPAGGAIPTQITVQPGPSFAATDSLRAEPPLERYDSTFAMKILTYEGGVTFGVPIKVVAAKAKDDTLRIAVRYEVCNAAECLPPKTEVMKLPVAIVAARKASR